MNREPDANFTLVAASGSGFNVLFKIRPAESGSLFRVYLKYGLQRLVQDSGYYQKMSRVLFSVWFIIQGIIQNTTCSVCFRIQRTIQNTTCSIWLSIQCIIQNTTCCVWFTIQGII